MLISGHIQKTAGTSFRHSIEEYYGDKLLTKYGEGSFKLSDLERNKKAITSILLNTEKITTELTLFMGTS